MPGFSIGDIVPNLEVETTHGKFKLHDYFNNSWTIIFSHPADFTPVCTTELGKMAEFEKRGVKLLGSLATMCNRTRSGSKTLKPTL